MSDLAGIALVTSIIWIGLFAYLFSIDRKVRKLEDE